MLIITASFLPETSSVQLLNNYTVVHMHSANPYSALRLTFAESTKTVPFDSTKTVPFDSTKTVSGDHFELSTVSPDVVISENYSPSSGSRPSTVMETGAADDSGEDVRPVVNGTSTDTSPSHQ